MFANFLRISTDAVQSAQNFSSSDNQGMRMLRFVLLHMCCFYLS